MPLLLLINEGYEGINLKLNRIFVTIPNQYFLEYVLNQVRLTKSSVRIISVTFVSLILYVTWHYTQSDTLSVFSVFASK